MINAASIAAATSAGGNPLIFPLRPTKFLQGPSHPGKRTKSCWRVPGPSDREENLATGPSGVTHVTVARAQAPNERSWHVLEKLGMVREGLLRGHYLEHGEPKDYYIYGVLRDEWNTGS